MKHNNQVHWISWVGVILALVGAGAASGDQPLKPEEFAYGFSIEVRGGAPFQQVTLPVEFYRGITREDLRDLAVLDAEGRSVPYDLGSLGSPPLPVVTEWVPFFPITEQMNQRNGGLSLSLRRSPDGTLLELKAQPDLDPGDRVKAYILDLSFLQDAYSALDLKVQQDPGPNLFHVTLEGSDDLSRWVKVGPTQAIARLSHGGHLLQKERLEVPTCRHKYLRLTWESDGSPFKLLEARVEYSIHVTEDLHRWEVLTGERKGSDPSIYFDTRGLVPVGRVKVVFPGTNVAVPVRVHSRTKPEDAWRLRCEALVHRLQVDGEVYSAEEYPLEGIVRDRYWKVEARMALEAYPSTSPVELHVGWTPQRLVFLAQGEGPYTLAFGSASRQTTPLPLESLLSRLSPEARNRQLIRVAAVGAVHTLGGEQALRPVEAPPPYKQWILWAVLLAGLAIMGWMALKLHRQLTRQAGEPRDGQGG